MRTLRKALCLVLVAVMVMGFGAFSVSAADNLASFSDGSSVSDTYKQAIDLLVGIQVVEGMDDGTLNLTGQYTREQAATIVARIKLGVTNANNLRCVSAPFTDVAADRWSAGAIAYCAQANILDGMGDGTFHPTEPLTGYAFGKMLLCAVGYGQRDEYVGPGWEINVAKDGVKREIYATSDLGAATNEAITRQQAMLMAYNTLVKTEVVKYSTLINDYVSVNSSVVNGGVAGDSVDQAFLMSDNFRNISLARGPVEYSTRVRSYSINETLDYVTDYLSRANLSNEDRWIVNFLNPGDEIKIPAEYSDVGRVAQVWYNRNGKNNQPEAITGIHMVDTKLGESNDATSLTALTSSSNKSKFIAERDVNSDGKSTVKYYLNGDKSDFDTIDGLAQHRGVTVALYDSNRNNKADVIVATERRVFKLNAAPSISSDGKNINLSGILIGTRELEKVRGYEGLQKDDFVMYVEDAEEILHLEKCRSFTGTLSRYNDNGDNPTMYFGSDSYKLSQLDGVSTSLYSNIIAENGNQCNIYLDTCNNIVGYAKVSTGAPNYVALLDVYYDRAGNNLNNNIKNDVHAKLLKTDGTVMNVLLDGMTIDITDYLSYIRENGFLWQYLYSGTGLESLADYAMYVDGSIHKFAWTEMYANGNNEIVANVRFNNRKVDNIAADVKTLFNGLQNKFFSYRMGANNKYTLELVQNQDAGKQVQGASKIVRNGYSQINLGTDARTFYGNNATTYIYWNSNSNNYRVLTGVNSAPDSLAGAEVTVMSNNKLTDTQNSVASVVFITEGEVSDSGTAYFFPSAVAIAKIADDPSTPNINEEGSVYRVLNTKNDQIEEMILTPAAAVDVEADGTGWYNITKGGSNFPNDYASRVTMQVEKENSTRRGPGVGVYTNSNGIITLGKKGIDLSSETYQHVTKLDDLSTTYAYEDDVKVYVVNPGDNYSLTVGGKELLTTDINDIVYPTSVNSNKKESASSFIVIKVAEPKLKEIKAIEGQAITFDVEFDDVDVGANYFYVWRLYVSGNPDPIAVSYEDADDEFLYLKQYDGTKSTVTFIPTVKNTAGVYDNVYAVKDRNYTVNLTLVDVATGVTQVMTLRQVGQASTATVVSNQ